MSHQWIRTRGLANSTPAVEPGGVEVNEWDPGGDVQLPDDHFARLHNPQNGRVPPQLPSAITRPQYPEFPPLQYERSFILTPGTLNRDLAFVAQSVRVDNYSSHWVFLQNAGMYIPPFIYGVIVTLSPGTRVAQYNLIPPPGYSDPTPVLESNVVTIWYEDSIQNNPGTPIQSSFRTGASGGSVVSGPLVFNPDNTYDIGASGANRPRNVYVAGSVSVPNSNVSALYLTSTSGAFQDSTTGASIRIGSGAPTAGVGSNSDYYFRTDTPGTANQRIYVKSAGAWVGIV